MSVCRNPFAIKNGEMIFIDDLSESERGLSCGCLCPVCEDKFIARMGDVKVHHFAHSNEGCSETLAYTTGLYMMLKQMFDEGCAFYVPALVVGYYIHSCKHISLNTVEQFVKILPETTLEDYTIVVAKGKYIKFDSAELSYDKRNHIQALELSYNGRSMAIKVTLPDTVCKIGTVTRHNSLPTLEMDFRDEGDTIQNANSAFFREYVSTSKTLSQWIYNEKIKTVYPQIIEKNNKQYDEYLKRKKEQEILRQQQLKEHQKWKREQEQLLKQKTEERKRIETVASIPREEKERQGYEQVKNLFTQQENRICDSYGARWIQCEICCEIKTDYNFSSYGGTDHVNLGICSECSRSGARSKS